MLRHLSGYNLFVCTRPRLAQQKRHVHVWITCHCLYIIREEKKGIRHFYKSNRTQTFIFSWIECSLPPTLSFTTSRHVSVYLTLWRVMAPHTVVSRYRRCRGIPVAVNATANGRYNEAEAYKYINDAVVRLLGPSIISCRRIGRPLLFRWISLTSTFTLNFIKYNFTASSIRCYMYVGGIFHTVTTLLRYVLPYPTLL